ncbi:MAG: cytochrome b [Thiohalospira sp.]
MHWRNGTDYYGLMAILFHWVVAAGVIGLFALGLWMVELTYYDPWYKTSLGWHKAFGVLLFGVMVARLIWRLTNPRPRPHGRAWERRAAEAAHLGLYLLIFAAMVAGYLISTADGSDIDVFGLFSVPATLTGKGQEDIAGEIHEILAWTIIGLASIHALAAVKHAAIDRDGTLRRMLRPGP